MIHAHHFHFIDQPVLREEYDAFGFDRTRALPGQRIVVREMRDFPGFERRSEPRYMSNRLCHYLGDRGLEAVAEGIDWGLEVEGVLSLRWDAANRRIEYGRAEGFTPKLLRFWIWHTFFPIVLELERSFKMMHAGSVEVDGAPILFCAPAFGGKSTMTDYFLRRGHPLYADDTLPIRLEGGAYVAYPSFPYHRPYREPETLGYPVENFAAKPAPVKALFDLHGVAPDAPVQICPEQGVEKFKAFFYGGFIKFPFMKKHRLDYFARMARRVPVYRVEVPWDRARLPEVYDAILATLEREAAG